MSRTRSSQQHAGKSQATFLFLARLRVAFFDGALRLPMRTLSSLRSGDLLNRVMAEIDTLDQVLLRVLVPTASALIVVTGTLVFLAFQSAPVSVLVAIMLCVTGLGLPVLMTWLGQRPGASFVEARAGARTHCVEALQGREEIASYHAEERAKQQVARYLAAADRAQHAQRQLSALGAGLTTALASTTTLGALLLGLWFVDQGRMSGPVVVMICLIILGLFESIEGLPLAYQFLGQTRRAAQRLNALLLTEQAESSYTRRASNPTIRSLHAPEPKASRDRAVLAHGFQESPNRGSTASGSVLMAPVSPTIRLQHVRFRYDQVRGDVFNELTFTISAGSFVAITGPSGSGKSTLLRLLAGEIEPTQGTISLERLEARETVPGRSPIDRGECMMFIAQESHIFHTTLRENLLMAKPDATEQELRHVLDAVCLTNLVERLEQGLDTRLGEHGDMLSGGERRRLSIARAMLTSPCILLLDKPSAGVDSSTARQVLSSIRSLLPESTIVVATHDPWLVAMAEQQIRLWAGNFTIAGSPFLIEQDIGRLPKEF
ncbi:MAG: amino acid ABC transporter ATP-binding/permease protein [Ktedonobacteraceae bacterium]